MLKGSQGFTLIEVMITMGIVSLLALAISSMMMNQQKLQKNMQAKATFNSLVGSVQSAASNPNLILNSSNAQSPQNVVNAVIAVDSSN